MCVRPLLNNPVVNEHCLIVSLAAAEYEEDGVVSVTTYMAMTNAGLMADEIIEDIEENANVQRLPTDDNPEGGVHLSTPDRG